MFTYGSHRYVLRERTRKNGQMQSVCPEKRNLEEISAMASIRNPWSKLSRRRRQEAWIGLLFTLPWIISLIALTIYPILDTFYLSFTDYSILEAPKWVGLSNYEEIFLKDAAVRTRSLQQFILRLAFCTDWIGPFIGFGFAVEYARCGYWGLSHDFLLTIACPPRCCDYHIYGLI